jgi:hypothetical protein
LPSSSSESEERRLLREARKRFAPLRVRDWVAEEIDALLARPTPSHTDASISTNDENGPAVPQRPSEKLQQGTPHTVAWVASVISENPLIASLLYDIDLLPEQIKEGDERRYNYMLAVIGHMKAALSATEESKRDKNG